MNEREMLAWLEQNDAMTATMLHYCETAEDMRRVMNKATGLEIEPECDVDEACGRWLAVLRANKQ